MRIATDDAPAATPVKSGGRIRVDSGIVIAGKGNMAVEVLLHVIDNCREDLIGVVCNRNETGDDNHLRSLRRAARDNGVYELSLEECYGIENLIFLSLEFDRIIRPSKFKSSARLFNIHFSLLPSYKGMYTSAMPILNGEDFSGVTLHRIDAGIDTGEIIDQEKFSISEMDCRELYFTCHGRGAALMLKNLDDIREGRESSRPQEAAHSTYYSKSAIDYSDLHIDLNQTADFISRQIRAFSFREFQLPKVNDIPIIDFHITGNRSVEKPGTLIEESDKHMLIATIDYDIILYKDRLGELLSACRRGDLETVKDICSVRKHIRERDALGRTPLSVASENNRADIVSFLTEK